MTSPIHHLKKYDLEGCWNWDSFGYLGSGIKDKNGVEIYEGDKVKVAAYDNDVVTITFFEGAFWLGDGLDLLFNHFPTDLEVVGHIEH